MRVRAQSRRFRGDFGRFWACSGLVLALQTQAHTVGMPNHLRDVLGKAAGLFCCIDCHQEICEPGIQGWSGKVGVVVGD
jgi:hypothetical protein